MHTLTCDQTRRELDDLMLSDKISKAIAEHLNNCSACQDFHTTQTKLRQMVGGLGTVQAPADFDFRLRARLASEPPASGFNFWPVAKWSTTGVAAVLLFVGGFSVVQQLTEQNPHNAVVTSNPGSGAAPAPAYEHTPRPQSSVSDNGSVVTTSSPSAPQKGIKASPVRREKRPQVATDFSSEQAGVTNPTQPGREVIFRVDATGQAITVSLDDGRGNARTISVPTITFGSQRVIGSNNQYAPKGVW